MAKNRRRKGKNRGTLLHPDTTTSILAIVFVGVALVLLLAAFGSAGPVGDRTYIVLEWLLGVGYYLVPAALIFLAISFLINGRRKVFSVAFGGTLLLVLSGLGILDIIRADSSGIVGQAIGGLEALFGYWAALIINITLTIASILVVLNTPLNITGISRFIKENLLGFRPRQKEDGVFVTDSLDSTDEGEEEEVEEKEVEEKNLPDDGEEEKPEPDAKEASNNLFGKSGAATFSYKGEYIPPPLSLLKTTSEKPTVGDLRANANIIKRTLESFGIPVEMGEITIGPKVTRYTLKPAEGVKLSRITALNQDLALALAAHPIRIEAPIPGKSLVGIELPNKVASIVRLGGLLNYPDFQKAAAPTFALGRDVSGDPQFIDISKLPHLLVAGTTGSGKSVTIHSIIMSLLYKNSPQMLRLILIDPKRVELSVYDGLPHLATPVITEGKKAIGALKFAIQEMERRYETLLQAGCRDIGGYNAQQKKSGEFMPYLVIVIDELADLMASYGREVEGTIVRLAQMARATGIHLIVSTQRPSVEVITGLIKANITSRIALQVASQVDSRTILDAAGAEKLLGGGDMLFISSTLSKPRRIQASFVTDDEIKSVVSFIVRNNSTDDSEDISDEITETIKKSTNGEYDDEDDDLYDEAVEVVREAHKASASYLQRRLKVGYARAARLLDIMEARGLVGPGDGAKAREVFIDEDSE